MSDKVLCPVCGSDKVESIVQKEIIYGDLGKILTADIPHEKCIECDFEGDLSGESEKEMVKALSTLNQTYVEEVLNFFDERKISYAGIERAVGLPQRTLTKWKNGISSPTAAGIALLKYLRAFPWLIEVAEHKFDFNISQKIFISTALNIFVNSVDFNQSYVGKNEIDIGVNY
jgi:DNA-binding transcriptional regulator YiaG